MRAHRVSMIGISGVIGVYDLPDLFERWLAVVLSGPLGVFEACELKLIVPHALADELCLESRNLGIAAFAQDFAVLIGD